MVQHPLQWRHNGPGSVSNHQRLYCLLNRFCGCRSKKTSKLLVTGLCEGKSPGTGEFPAQMASSAENVSIWWRHLASVARRHNTMQWCIETQWLASSFPYFSVLMFTMLLFAMILLSDYRSLTLSQCTLAGPVYTGMPLECHWLTQCTLECHWKNLVETDPHLNATGEA